MPDDKLLVMGFKNKYESESSGFPFKKISCFLEKALMDSWIFISETCDMKALLPFLCFIKMITRSR